MRKLLKNLLIVLLVINLLISAAFAAEAFAEPDPSEPSAATVVDERGNALTFGDVDARSSDENGEIVLDENGNPVSDYEPEESAVNTGEESAEAQYSGGQSNGQAIDKEAGMAAGGEAANYQTSSDMASEKDTNHKLVPVIAVTGVCILIIFIAFIIRKHKKKD